MNNKSENWIDPKVIEFTLSRWDKEDHTVYMGTCNGVYYGCKINSSIITPEDIAKEILDIDITPKVKSSRLSKTSWKIHGEEVLFYFSMVRVEVSYGMR